MFAFRFDRVEKGSSFRPIALRKSGVSTPGDDSPERQTPQAGAVTPATQTRDCCPSPSIAPILRGVSGHSNPDTPTAAAEHPRTLGWVATTALAMGGSNQSLFLITALFAGQGEIPGQGSAAVPLLILGLFLGWVAAPGWTELVLMYPKRVGGIAATCAEAFRPYNPVFANLTGVCYWWGWVPTCGLTAIFSAAAIHEWYLPGVPVPVLSCTLVLFFTAVNLCGVKWAGRLAIPIATASAALAFISALAPVVAGQVDWQQAATFHLTVPFEGWFGELTGFMAGLYLIGFAAPAFEAAACHVGETVNPNKNVPRAMLASALMASMYFIAAADRVARRAGARATGQGSHAGIGTDVRAGVRQLRQGSRHLVHDVQHVSRHPAAARRCGAHDVAARRGWPAAAHAGAQVAHRRALGGHLPHSGHGDPLPAARRPDLAGGGRQLHLSHRHLPAQRGGLAAAKKSAGSPAPLSRTARDDRSRAWSRQPSGPSPRFSDSSSSG